MAQTTNAISFRDCDISYSVAGSVFTAFEGHGVEITVSGGDRATAEAFTFDGDTPVLTSGKRAALDVTVKYVYTEAGGTDLQEIARAAYETPTALYVKWIPKGAAGYTYTTSAGVVTSQPYPSGAAGSADAVMITLTIKCASITKTVT